MERESGKRNINNNSSSSNYINHNQQRQQNRERIGHGLGIGIGDTFRTRSSSTSDTPPPPLTTSSSSPDFVLQWGNKKRLRCMKFQSKPDSSDPAHRTTARVDRRVITIDNRRTASPPPPHRVLRNSDNMRVSSQGHGTNGVAEHVKLHTQEGKRATPASANNHHHHPHNNSNDVAFEMAHEEGNKKSGGGGGSSSGSEVIPPAVWPPKFVIALTNKEKEEDFMAIKGSKLPQRPKKRSKYVQRNLKLVSPGAWLCDLTLERYEVREKKTSKKRPRGLKAMCSTSMDSDSE